MKIRALEDAVCNLLGGAHFPFPSGPAKQLSQEKVKKDTKTAVLASESVPNKPAVVEFLRPLHLPGENAYHLFYIDESGQKMDSFQNDRELILDILALQNSEFYVHKMETVFFENIEKWQCVEVLFDYEEETK
ncbi:MAG: hypothetical protein WCS73_08045 [Lentisphaeria bacterium]